MGFEATTRGRPRRSRRSSCPFDRQRLASLEPSAGRLARRELEDGLGAPLRGGAPRPEVVRDLEHAEPLVEEDRVDRKAHEKRVDRAGRAKEETFARIQLFASEQA